MALQRMMVVVAAVLQMAGLLVVIEFHGGCSRRKFVLGWGQIDAYIDANGGADGRAVDAGDAAPVPSGCWSDVVKSLAPYLWYPLDDNLVSDPVRNLVDGSPVGTYDPSTVPGQAPAIATGQSMLFPGTDILSGVYTPFVPTGFPTEAFTLSLWIKPSEVTDGRTLVSYASSTHQNELKVYFGTLPELKIRIRGLRYRRDIALKLVNWQLLTISWESAAGSLKFYHNGALAASLGPAATGVQLVGDGSLYLAQDQDRVRNPASLRVTDAYRGQLDEFLLWSRALGAAEVAALHAGANVSCP